MANLTFHFEDIAIGFPLLLQGLVYTVLIAAASFTLAFPIGVALALLRGEMQGWPGKLATAYIEFMRGIPLILLLVFVHYGLLPMLVGHADFLVSSLLTFTLFEAAYIAEIVRGGLRAVNRIERESAKSLGLDTRQQLLHVILPLALKRMMPALVGQLISLLKDTSLASIVGVVEFTRAGEIIYEQRYHDFEILLFQAVVYFTLCFALSRLGKRLEISRSDDAPTGPFLAS